MEEIVYHYTSFEVLQKILNGGKLRFTKMNSLNDKSEYQHGIQLLKNKIAEFENDKKITKKFDCNLFDRFSFANSLYSISFTRNGDNLAFWNSYYVDKMKAVCIGFSKNEVFDSGFIINGCLYGDPYPKMTAERYRWFTDIFERRNILGLSKNREYIHITFQTAHIKAKAFEYEQECRAVSFCPKNVELGTFQRNGKTVEFFDQPINLNSIKEIIIGPSRNQDSTHDDVLAVTENMPHSFQVIKSMIPFEL